MLEVERYNEMQQILASAEKINPNSLAKQILAKEHLITISDTEEIYSWNPNTGLYEPCETTLNYIIQFLAGEKTTTHFVNEVKNSIKRQTYIPRERIGEETNLIPLENCIYNFRKNTTQKYTPGHIFLKKHPIVWTDKKLIEENPIDTFLEQVTETHEDILLLKELAGYCFYRKMPFQNFFILYGSGANGKSVYLNILRAMIGKENTSGHSLQALTENRFAKADLYQRNANIFADLPKKAFQDVGAIKELTGGDETMAEQKFKTSFLFWNYAKLIASCNEVPESPDMTDGFFRRPIIIHFPRSFDGKEDINLLEKLCKPEYLLDFFKTSVNAFRLALKQKSLIRNERIHEKREKYITFSNSAIAFINDKLEYDPEDELPSEEIFGEYKKFCKDRNVIKLDERIFFQKLYRFFGHKVWKKRIVDSYGDKKVRRYVIVGVYWHKK